MYVIETELGRFEGETEKDAKRLLRKAQREADKQRKVEMEHARLARLEARSNGFSVLTAFHKGTPSAHPWVIEPGDKWWNRYVRVDEENPRQSYVKVIDLDDVPEISLYAYRCIGVSLLVDGSVQVIWTEDMDREGEVYPMSVGFHENTYSIEYLPDEITMEWCRGNEHGAKGTLTQAYETA